MAEWRNEGTRDEKDEKDKRDKDVKDGTFPTYLWSHVLVVPRTLGPSSVWSLVPVVLCVPFVPVPPPVQSPPALDTGLQ
jgi:hypothetical protein